MFRSVLDALVSLVSSPTPAHTQSSEISFADAKDASPAAKVDDELLIISATNGDKSQTESEHDAAKQIALDQQQQEKRNQKNDEELARVSRLGLAKQQIQYFNEAKLQSDFDHFAAERQVIAEKKLVATAYQPLQKRPAHLQPATNHFPPKHTNVKTIKREHQSEQPKKHIDHHRPFLWKPAEIVIKNPPAKQTSPEANNPSSALSQHRRSKSR